MQNSIQRQWCFLRTACVLAALTISAAAHAADITYETRALTGTDGPLGPGLGAGVNFSGFIGPPALNGMGQTAFRGTLAGPGVTTSSDSGIWSEGGGSGLALVAREGSQAPGTAEGVIFSELSLLPVINGAGQTAFWGSLAGAGVTSANDSGIWSGGGVSGPALVAREGSQVPGTDADVNFGSFAFANLVLNGAGQTAFHGTLAGPGVTTSSDSGIWSEGNGSGLALVARKGSQAPGTAAGVNFSNFNNRPVLNGAGQAAFWGFLTGAGVDNLNDQGIWREGGGSSLALIARKGSQAPGTDAGVNFGGFGTLSLNGAGQTAFMGGLIGAGVTSVNNRGIWSEGGGLGLALVAREGSQAPGTAEGVIFSEFLSPVINGAGQTAFMGDLTGPGVTPWVNSRCIWATDPDGQLHLVGREGDHFDVNNDPLNPDPRTISSINMAIPSGGEDGRVTSLNNAGQLAFWLRFTDGSEGIFVATIAIPLKVTITPTTAPATGYDFTWNSRPGKVYDLVSSTDLVTPVAQWPVHAAYSDIPATGTTTTLTAVPVTGPQRFFAVIEKDAPPAN